MNRKVGGNHLGFTIVELLIVVVVIAILAAITIVSYNGITNRAKASAAQSAAESAAKKVMIYMTTNADQVPPDLATAGVTSANGTTYQYNSNSSTSPQTFCLTATTSNTSYYINNTDHSSPTAGACAGQAPNGGVTITNLLTNPSIESGSSYWSAVSGATVTTATSPTHSGTTSAQVVTTSANASQGVFITAGTLAAAGTYSGGMWVNAPAGLALYCSVRVVYGGTTYDQTPYTYMTGNGSWQYCALGSVTAPTSASLQVYVRTQTATAATFYVDDAIAAQASSVANYADGNTSGWIWNGAANNSTSTGPPQ